MDATTLEQQEEWAGEQVTQVLRWRFGQLCRAGFDADDATVLATHACVDLHGALDLVGHGCPPKLAVRILV
jgi:hypothetical protein